MSAAGEVDVIILQTGLKSRRQRSALKKNAAIKLLKLRRCSKFIPGEMNEPYLAALTSLSCFQTIPCFLTRSCE